MDNPLATIFIVDDDVDVCRALTRLLRSVGFMTRTYGSATEFLAEHDPEPPGCIILDLAMPELDGLEVQAMLAASGCRRPIIFLTGNGSIEMTVTAIRAGAINFLTKPVEEPKLFEAVDEALHIDAIGRTARRMRRALEERLDAHAARTTGAGAGRAWPSQQTDRCRSGYR